LVGFCFPFAKASRLQGKLLLSGCAMIGLGFLIRMQESSPRESRSKGGVQVGTEDRGWCWPDGAVQPHAIWHLASALSLGLCYA